MSLEDKAKEYAKNIWQSDDPRTEVDREHSAEDYEAGWRQAIDDLMERAKENKNTHGRYVASGVEPRAIEIKVLEKIAKDLKK